MMIVAIAHTTSRHTTSTTGTTTAVLIVVTVGMVTVIATSVAVIDFTVSVVVTMVTGSVLSRKALVVTVCDSAVAVYSAVGKVKRFMKLIIKFVAIIEN